MSSKTVENLFKFVFFLAIVASIILAIGIFLLVIKFSLNFIPEIRILGVSMTN